MKRIALLLAGAACALSSGLLLAQDAPESLLPPGFDKPAAKPAAKPAQAPGAENRGAPTSVSTPVIQPLPQAAVPGLPEGFPSLDEISRMSPDQLDALFGLKPQGDIPPAARRAMTRVGVIASWEGGFPSGSLARQNASLIGAAIEGNKGILVSRWGHILLRRALASRLDAPAGMAPADFAAMRAALLVRMGEGDAARALVQDVDGQNYTPALTQAALDAYAQTADITGICPIVAIQGGARRDPDWRVLSALCGAFSGGDNDALVQLDRLDGAKVWPKIDMLLAEKYAGAAGKARRAVTIEWDGVNDLNPWRYALAIATGLQPPERLLRNAPVRYAFAAATAPALPLQARAAGADKAAAAGILSSAAMVDLYGQIYDQDDITGDWADRANDLRSAYVGETPAERLASMKKLWSGAVTPEQRYSRLVMTAYAAARLPALSQFGGDAGDLIASMLTAGLDRNAMAWAQRVSAGSLGWAQLALANPDPSGRVSASDLSSFYDNDDSANRERTRFLLAGLAGLGRIDAQTRADMAGKLSVDINRQTRWTRTIDAAAQVNNAELVALLAGLGMQANDWDKMTTVYLYHIVAALNRVGLGAEARMIAAEAVARG